MMKRLKKLISYFMMIFIASTLFQNINVKKTFAADEFKKFPINSEKYEGSYFKYNENNGQISIEGVYVDIKYKEIELNIPSEIDGKPVTVIKKEAFSSNSRLKRLEIPNTVTDIEDGAFYNCSDLSEIKMPNSIRKIGTSTFRFCKKLKNIVIPNTVTSIGKGAFYNCNSLTSITIPESVNSLEWGAFRECENLTNVIILNSAINIGDYAFAECPNLENVSISNINLTNSEASIGIFAFSQCSNLKNITIPNTVISIGKYAFQDCISLKRVKIPNKVKNITYSSFRNCKQLEYIEIPNSVVSIQNYAFEGCSSLTDISLPNSIEKIGIGVFIDCINLKNVKISNKITDISMNLFQNCSALKKVEIPNSVESISQEAFENCTSLESIVIPMNTKVIDIYRTFRGCNNLTIYGYNNSRAQRYAAEKDIPFKFVDEFYGNKIKDYFNIPNDKYGIIVKDENGKNVSNGLVTINDKTSKINDVGVAIFDNNFSGECNYLRINCEGYYEYIDKYFNINKSKNYSNITIYSKNNSPYKLKYAKYIKNGNEKNILSEQVKLSNNDVFSLHCEVISNINNVDRYELWQKQGNKAIKISSNGIFENLNSSLFETDEDIFVKVYSKSGEIVTTYLNLEKVKENDMSNLKFSFGGEEMSIGVPEEIPYIGGGDLKISLPKSLPIEVESDSDGKVKVAINFDDCDEFDEKYENDYEAEKAWKKFKNNVKAFSQDSSKFRNQNFKNAIKPLKGMAGLNLGLDFSVVGYAEGQLTNEGLSNISGELCIKVQSSAEMGVQTVVYVVPITLELAVNSSIKAVGTISYDFNSSTLSSETDLKSAASLEPFAGIGISKLAAVGVFGKAELENTIQIGLQCKLKESILKGELGVKAYIGFLEYSKSWPNDDYKIYPKEEKNIGSVKSNSSLNSLYDMSNYSLIDRSYLGEKSNWLGNNKLTKFESSLKGTSIENNSNIKSLFKNTFGNSSPKIISSKNDIVMVFIDDDKTRDEYNVGKLVYSTYDKNTDTWSEPIQVDSNNTSDNSSYLYSDGNDIYVIYQDAKKIFTDTIKSNFDEYTKSLGITVAKFNTSNKKFENISTLTTTSNYNSQPKISIINKIPTAVWVCNTNGDYFGLNGTNNIVYSEFINGKWALPKILVKNLNCITDINVGALNNKFYVAYCLDKDNNLETTNDKTLNIVDKNGITKNLSNGLVSNPIFTIMPDTNLDSLLWYENGNIKVSNDLSNKIILRESGINKLTDDFVIAGNKIIYCNSDKNNNSNIYMSIYDRASNAWSDAIKITNQEKYINDISVVEVDNNLLATFMQNDITITENNIEESSNLCYSMINEINDISLNDVYYEFSDIVPNKNMKLYCEIENKGQNTINNLVAEIKDSNSNVLQRKEINKNILSSETEKLEVDFLVPSEIKDNDYTITVYEKGKDDNNIEDNSSKFNIGYTDLSVNTNIVKKGNEECILAEVKNESYVNTSGTLNIYGTGSSETPVATKKIDELKAGETKLYYIELGEEYFNDNKKGVVKVSVSSDKEEYYDSNNSDEEYVYYKHKITFVNDDKEYYVTDCMDSTALTSFPDAPIKNGKQFAGWYKDVNCTDGNEFDEKTIINDDITVYAKWIDKIEIESFIADKASPQISGTTVKLSVKAKGNGILKYKFIIKDSKGNWYLLRDYGTSNTYNWTTGAIGDKTLYVDVKDENGQVVRKSMNYIVKEKILAPEISSFISDKASPQVSGTTVNLSVKAKGTGTLQYKFLIKDASGNWFVIQDYSSSNIAVWKASKTGNKILYVDVKDLNGQVTRKSMSYTITAAAQTVTSFTADKKSSQASGIQLLLMAQATGEGELQYKFLVKDASGNWFVIQDYSSSNIAVWKASKTGNRTLYVDVKDSNGQVTRKSMNYIVK